MTQNYEHYPIQAIASAIGGFKNLGIAAVFIAIAAAAAPVVTSIVLLTASIVKLGLVARKSAIQAGIGGGLSKGLGKLGGKIFRPLAALTGIATIGGLISSGAKKDEVSEATGSVLGGLGGAAAGAVAGAALGSVIPIIGTTIGGLLGGVLGGFGGDFMGGKIGKTIGSAMSEGRSGTHRSNSFVPLGGGGRVSNSSYNVNINGANMDSNEVAKTVVREVKRFDQEKARRQGAKMRGRLHDRG